MKTLNELCDEAFRIAVEHGFTDASVGEDLMLMVTELAEAMEDHRAGRSVNDVWYEEKTEHRTIGRHHETFVGERVIAGVDTHVNEYATITGLDAKLRKPCGIPSELADVVIRVLHFCGKHGIDIEKAVEEKMAFNASRPYKHGKKV